MPELSKVPIGELVCQLDAGNAGFVEVSMWKRVSAGPPEPAKTKLPPDELTLVNLTSEGAVIPA